MKSLQNQSANSPRQPGASAGRDNDAAAVVAALVVVLCSSPAHAFRTAAELPGLDGATEVVWAQRDVEFHLNVGSRPAPLEAAEVEAALASALEAWTAPECSGVMPRVGGRTEDLPEPMDGMNTVSWVTDWSARGFAQDAAANTDVQYLRVNGEWEIAEADIYLNAEDFEWAVGPSPGVRDVMAVLTHEVGHALGILHPCDVDSGIGGHVDP